MSIIYHGELEGLIYGKAYTMQEYADFCGVAKSTMRGRLKHKKTCIDEYLWKNGDRNRAYQKIKKEDIKQLETETEKLSDKWLRRKL